MSDDVATGVPTRNRSRLSLVYGVPIGLLGGLIGLGGAEFRLPVLVGPLGYAAREAVPLNLAVSLVTLLASLLIRARTLSLEPVAPLADAILSLITGAVVTAFVGATIAGRLSKEQLERVIVVLLVAIGVALIAEAFLPGEVPGLLPEAPAWRIGAGVLFGLAIGLASSLLGVAGGELIIPTLVFAFGADIRTAGTASLLISVPTVAVGLVRYAGRGAFADRRPLRDTVAPMSVGSIIGATLGGLLVGLVPVPLLKVLLGAILNVSAWRMFKGQH
jgi:uncharacterized membrane protein YfcA